MRVRIGAHDQMQALGQMLDVPVHVAESLAETPELLEQLGHQRFVLIDTPGMSQRDAQLSARMTELAAAGHGIETALVLAASTQAGAIAETVTRFATANAMSVLLTKVDEAASLGGILSVLALAELPVSYVSEGQRVPEDLRPAALARTGFKCRAARQIERRGGRRRLAEKKIRRSSACPRVICTS